MTNPRNQAPKDPPDDTDRELMGLSAYEINRLGERDLISLEEFKRWMEDPKNREAHDTMMKNEVVGEMGKDICGLLFSGLFRISLVVGLIGLLVLCILNTCSFVLSP